jgi:hypothetical protein
VIPLLINQSNISLDFSLQLSKSLADSDLVVIGLTGIEPIRKISVLDWFLPYWPNESFYIVLTDLIITTPLLFNGLYNASIVVGYVYTYMYVLGVSF